MSEKGYVQKVDVQPDSTASQITRAVCSQFIHVSAVAEFGFRVLIVKKASYTTQRGVKSKRVEFRLRPSKAVLDMESWAR